MSTLRGPSSPGPPTEPHRTATALPRLLKKKKQTLAGLKIECVNVAPQLAEAFRRFKGAITFRQTRRHAIP